MIPQGDQYHPRAHSLCFSVNSNFSFVSYVKHNHDIITVSSLHNCKKTHLYKPYEISTQVSCIDHLACTPPLIERNQNGRWLYRCLSVLARLGSVEQPAQTFTQLWGAALMWRSTGFQAQEPRHRDSAVWLEGYGQTHADSHGCQDRWVWMHCSYQGGSKKQQREGSNFPLSPPAVVWM